LKRSKIKFQDLRWVFFHFVVYAVSFFKVQNFLIYAVLLFFLMFQLGVRR